ASEFVRGATMKRAGSLVSLGLLLWALVPIPCDARVVRFVVEQKRVVSDGKAYGAVGAYERLDGTAYIEVDPRDPLNAVIVNLDKASRTPSGKVGLSSPFFILKPVDMRRGNHKILYGVNNRGRKLDLPWRTIGGVFSANNPLTAADFGDGLLFRLGYT